MHHHHHHTICHTTTHRTIHHTQSVLGCVVERMMPCTWLDRLCGDKKEVVVCYLCQEEVTTEGWLSGDHRYQGTRMVCQQDRMVNSSGFSQATLYDN